MKKDYIELYLNNVISYLPQKEREDVYRELKSNIYDMLSDEPTEEEIKSVLESLGDPRKLADKYRIGQRYLISPDVYSNYITVLKIVVPIVAIINAYSGLVDMIIEIINSESSNYPIMIAEVIASFISSGISGAFSAAVFVTCGFVIYERINQKKNSDQKNINHKEKWEISKLNDVPSNNQKNRISHIGTIVTISFVGLFSILAMLIILDVIPNFIVAKINDVEVYSMFAKGFLNHCLYIIPIMALTSISLNIYKLYKKEWTREVVLFEIIANIIYTVSVIFLFTRSVIYSDEFISFLNILSSEASINFTGRLITILVLICAVISAVINFVKLGFKFIKINKTNL